MQSTLQSGDGPIDAPKTVQDVRQEPYPLPERWAAVAHAIRALAILLLSVGDLTLAAYPA